MASTFKIPASKSKPTGEEIQLDSKILNVCLKFVTLQSGVLAVRSNVLSGIKAVKRITFTVSPNGASAALNKLQIDNPNDIPSCIMIWAALYHHRILTGTKNEKFFDPLKDMTLQQVLTSKIKLDVPDVSIFDEEIMEEDDEEEYKSGFVSAKDANTAYAEASLSAIGVASGIKFRESSELTYTTDGVKTDIVLNEYQQLEGDQKLQKWKELRVPDTEILQTDTKAVVSYKVSKKMFEALKLGYFSFEGAVLGGHGQELINRLNSDAIKSCIGKDDTTNLKTLENGLTYISQKDYAYKNKKELSLHINFGRTSATSVAVNEFGLVDIDQQIADHVKIREAIKWYNRNGFYLYYLKLEKLKFSTHKQGETLFVISPSYKVVDNSVYQYLSAKVSNPISRQVYCAPIFISSNVRDMNAYVASSTPYVNAFINVKLYFKTVFSKPLNDVLYQLSGDQRAQIFTKVGVNNARKDAVQDVIGYKEGIVNPTALPKLIGPLSWQTSSSLGIFADVSQTNMLSMDPNKFIDMIVTRLLSRLRTDIVLYIRTTFKDDADAAMKDKLKSAMYSLNKQIQNVVIYANSRKIDLDKILKQFIDLVMQKLDQSDPIQIRYSTEIQKAGEEVLSDEFQSWDDEVQIDDVFGDLLSQLPYVSVLEAFGAFISDDSAGILAQLIYAVAHALIGVAVNNIENLVDNSTDIYKALQSKLPVIGKRKREKEASAYEQKKRQRAKIAEMF